MTRIVAWCLGFMKWVSDDPSYVTGGEPKYPQELFSAVDLLSLQFLDKASSVKVPVANVTLFSSAHLLRENTDSVRSNQRIRPTAPSVPLKQKDNVVEEEDGEWIRFLGGNSSSGTKKYRGSNSSDGGNIGDGVKIAGEVIGSGDEIEFSEELKELLPQMKLGNNPVRPKDRILQPKESFRYLGSVIHRSRRIDEDVAHRIGVGWMKWMAASGVMCNRRIPLKLQGKFYRVAIRPAMLYCSECWPITKAQANRVEVAELRMLRWTCGKTMRRPKTAPVRRVEVMLVEGSRRRGRPKLRWEDRLKQDIKELLLSEDMTSDRNAWRDRIRVSG
ncbi:hypothetical protein Tco_0446128 [Tanacetum coccineum]